MSRFVESVYKKLLKKRKIKPDKNRFGWVNYKENLKNNSQGGTLVKKSPRNDLPG